MIWFTYATPLILVLAVYAAYRLGRRAREERLDLMDRQAELARAKQVVQELEQVAQQVRRSLAIHHSSILQFKDRVAEFSEHSGTGERASLAQQAEQILKPTLDLSSQIARAYDELRQQNVFAVLSDVRTDPLTGLCNRRGAEEKLRDMLALNARYNNIFSLGLIDVDGFRAVNQQLGDQRGNELLCGIAGILQRAARETDVVARFDGEEFIVLLPETNLAGASVFAERVRTQIAADFPLTVTIGLAAAADGDTTTALLSRADTALYSAKAGGSNCAFRHTGKYIELVEPQESRGEVTAQDDTPAQTSMSPVGAS